MAEYLTQKDVKVYGAYWCPHCYEREQLFGKEAWKNVKRTECGADAKENPQSAVCERAGLFPSSQSRIDHTQISSSCINRQNLPRCQDNT